jgi:hypothetical protein
MGGAMNKKARFAVVAGILALSGAVASGAVAAGSSKQARRGLTCHNTWGNTKGSTKCTGNRSVKWRLHVACQFQPDYNGPWNYGPGSDAFECNFGVQSASVQWG